MKTKKIVHILLCAAMIVTFSCSKEGPAGPQGEQGIQGVAGTDGKKGDKGDRGTANVIYSDWLEIQLIYGGIPDYYYCRINVPKLTSDIVNKGEVRMYFKSDAFIHPIPNREWPGLSYKFSTGEIFLISNDNYFDATYGYYYRYVLIPGGVHARLAGGQARSSSTPPDMNDYHAVCAYYGITE